jgi:ABC-type antimicrobial peptide transport system permease subunit
MLKSIFIQIWNRRRSNAWITVELVLVFFFVWNIADYLFVLQYNQHIPNSRDLQNTWKINLDEYPDVHPRYRAEESSPEARQANFTRILQTLHDHPAIEAVAVFCDSGSEPGSGGYSGTSARSPEDTTVYVSAQVIRTDPAEDFFRVFAYTTGKDRRAVSTRDFDALRPNVIVLGQMTADRLFPSGQALGKEVHVNGTDYTVTGIVGNVKRFDYTRPHNIFYLFPRRETLDVMYLRIAVRSSAAANASFKETFMKEMTGRLQTGNFYLKSVVSYVKIAADTDTMFGVSNNIREKVYLMIFFLLNILLCMMGTFWYRVNTRREEIGIRKAAGSSSAGIRRILLLEGLCLLAIAALPAMLIEYQFVRAGLIETMGKYEEERTPGLYLPDRMHLRFLITSAITCVSMAVVILAAIGLPARKAAALPPAEALHYD